MLEEYLYWECLEDTRKSFLQILRDDFSNSLKIPRKFVVHFKQLKDKEQVIKLVAPSDHTWNVKLMRNNLDAFLTDGWNKFVNDHSLENGDCLVFHFTGEATFRVLIFDESGCEKDSAYFIRHNYSPRTQRGRKDESAEVELISNEDTEGSSSRTHYIRDVPNSSSHKPMLATSIKKMLERNRRTAPTNHQMESSIKYRSDDAEEAAAEPMNLEQQKICVAGLSKKRPYSMSDYSNRRPATAKEKEKALSLAKRLKPTNPAFIAVMRHTNVYKNFFLVINLHENIQLLPIKFAAENLPQCDRNVVLLAENDDIWKLNYLWHTNSVRFGGGWKKFAEGNELEVDDVCHFELIDNVNLVFKVSIFRAVPKVMEQEADVSISGRK
ncbi:hypothetical protein ZIOFF_006648 [Zingiber officinale]|uniref:TF-B3 domain-containing protein n=1 Tax=Zingiber officinale TaxID=94328 RepID=A0A8J5LP19_ZINOF|nr:hypothetical protein ZIOFF_006648 [Zingiber officinale]